MAVNEKHCLMGMLIYGSNHDPKETHYIIEAIHQMFPERVHDLNASIGSIIFFNDHPDTTFEDIQKVLTQAEHIKNLPKGA